MKQNLLHYLDELLNRLLFQFGKRVSAHFGHRYGEERYLKAEMWAVRKFNTFVKGLHVDNPEDK